MPQNVKFQNILIACLIISIGQLSMGLVFPSLPWIAKDFSISLEQAQLLIGVYMLGFGPSQFIYGPISDSLGRRKVLITGLAIALAGLAIIILFSGSFYGLLAGRLLQGLGTGCCAVLARATVRDRFSGPQLPTAMSYIAMAASITPLFAPVLGGFINYHFGWSMVFISLFAYVLLASMVIFAKFDESLKVSKTIPSPKQMAQQYWTLLTTRYFVSFAGISWLNFSLMITTVSVMPFIMQNQIGMTSDEYALWALIPAIGMLLGTSTSNRLRPKIGSKNVLLISPALHVIAGIWLFVCPLEPLYLMLGQLVMIFSNGMALPCAQALVLQPYKKQAGSAAAMSGGGQMIFSSLVSTVLVHFGLSQPWHLAIVIFIFAGLNIINVKNGFSARTPS